MIVVHGIYDVKQILSHTLGLIGGKRDGHDTFTICRVIRERVQFVHIIRAITDRFTTLKALTRGMGTIHGRTLESQGILRMKKSWRCHNDLHRT